MATDRFGGTHRSSAHRGQETTSDRLGVSPGCADELGLTSGVVLDGYLFHLEGEPPLARRGHGS